MTDITTVTLEILRLGPPHNQLLSPLTRYLGVCGSHRAEEVSVPWEHRDFTSALEVLRYQGRGNHDRLDHLRRLGNEVTSVVSRVEGLKNQLSEANARRASTLIQLELVISASELAMLPYEIIRTFPGGPGSDEQFLVIQPNSDIEVTRRDRAVTTAPIQWPSVPKILFIAAQPDGMQVPFDAHLAALLAAVQPFLGAHDDSPEGLLQAASRFLTVLPAASVDEIQEVCSRERFGYVHILAHGLQDEEAPGMPFGLALHAGRGMQTREIVGGDRLALALRAHGKAPAVVTVAACDSGNVSDVVHSGASLAHDLHRVGLPFVVASQFPLSFEGSIELVEQVYRRLPQGEDPRQVTHDLRRRLYARYGAKTHDWASLVVYAALPHDIDTQLRRVCYQSASARIFALLDRIDHSLESEEVVDEDWDIDEAFAWLPSEGEWKIEAEGLRGSVAKRMAQIHWSAGSQDSHSGEQAHAEEHWDKSLELLRQSRQFYRSAASQSLVRDDDVLVKRPAMQWLLIQELCLDAVFGDPFKPERWWSAYVSCQADMSANKADIEIWATSSLIELYLLLWAWPDAIEAIGKAADEARLLDELDRACDQLIDQARDHGIPLASTLTRRQLERYTTWMWSEQLVAHQAKAGVVRKMIPGEQGGYRIVELALGLIDKLERA